MELLICGFEPFGKRSVNNAWEVASLFRDSTGIDVIKLPVSFENAHKKIIENLCQKSYDLIFIIGETSSTSDYVRLERVAINYKDSINSDNDGVAADDEEIIVDAPKAYFTPFPVKKIACILKENGHKVKVSNSAGTFVCNCVYYNILHHLSENSLSQIALFIHVPTSTETMSLPEMQQAITGIIEEYSKINQKQLLPCRNL